MKVLLMGLPLLAATAMAGISCPDTWVPNSANTRCFKNFYFGEETGSTKSSWLTGMQLCSSYGAPLATIHNADEDALVRALTSSADGDCFVGLRKYKKLKPEKGWLWIDRQVSLADSDYLNWGPAWKSIWKILPPDEKCGTYQSDGWGHRPCFGPGSKLPCFVCGTIDPEASEGAQLAYANNFNKDEWWIPPSVNGPDYGDWEGITGDGDNTNSITEDWLENGGDIDIGVSGDGPGLELPIWNPVDPSLIPTFKPTTTTTPPPPTTSTITEVTTTSTVTTVPPTTSTTTTPTPTTTPTTTPTATIATTTSTVSTQPATTSTTSTSATLATTRRPETVRTSTIRAIVTETAIRTRPALDTSTVITHESKEESDLNADLEIKVEGDDPPRIIGKGDSGNVVMISVALGVGLFVALCATTAGVVIYRKHRGKEAVESPTGGTDPDTENATSSSA